MSTTTDLSQFGARERKMLVEILEAWRIKGLPEDFDNSEVVPMMNMNSGFVFLLNGDYQVAMMNGDDLESFYNCPQCGHEGFLDEMEHGSGEPDDECSIYCNEIEVADDRQSK